MKTLTSTSFPKGQKRKTNKSKDKVAVLSTKDFLISLFEISGIDIFDIDIDKNFLKRFAKQIDKNIKIAGTNSFQEYLENDGNAGELLKKLKTTKPGYELSIARSILDFKKQLFLQRAGV